MSQELVLIPKRKYEILLQRSAKDQTDESNIALDRTTHKPEHEKSEEPTKVFVNNNQSGDGQKENNELQHLSGDGHPFAKMTYETFDKMQTKKTKKNKMHNSGKRHNSGWLTFDL